MLAKTHNKQSMKCCKEELGECSGATKKEPRAEESSCCGGGCSDEMACCNDEKEFRFSNALDAGKFVILSIVTMTMYHYYWMYRNWNHIKEYTKQPIRPIGRTVVAFIPIIDIVLFCTQFVAIHALTKKEGRRSFSLPWVCIGYSILLLASWAFFVLSFLFTDPAYAFVIFFFQTLLVLGMTLVLLPVQMALNDFWEREQPRRPLRTSYTNGEIAWIVVGGLFLLLSLVSFILPPSQPPYDYLPVGTDDGISYSAPTR